MKFEEGYPKHIVRKRDGLWYILWQTSSKTPAIRVPGGYATQQEALEALRRAHEKRQAEIRHFNEVIKKWNPQG